MQPPASRHVLTTASRQGTATLELVLSLPLLLVLVVAIVWLGSSVIGQSQVIIRARHQAWSGRTQASGQALLFLKDDIVSDQAADSVDIGPLFEGTPGPEASHDVLALAWDHQQLPLDRAPNWKQYAIAAANAKTGSAQVAWTDAGNAYSKWRGEAGNVWNTLGAALIRQLTGLGDAATSGFSEAERTGTDRTAERQRISRRIATAQTELRETRRQLRELDDDASDALKKVLRNKIKRLEAEIDRLRADRKAVDE